MRILKKFENSLFLLLLNFFETVDANLQVGIHGRWSRSFGLPFLNSCFKAQENQSNGSQTTTAPSRTTANFIPWEATTTSVSMTTMTPKRPSDGKNLCTVDAHCGPGGKCGPYCPIIEGLGTGFEGQKSSLTIVFKLEFHVIGVWCPYENICYCAPGTYGNKCKDTAPYCKEEFCFNGSKCNDLDFLQMNGCDCTGTGHHGPFCELNDCSG